MACGDRREEIFGDKRDRYKFPVFSTPSALLSAKNIAHHIFRSETELQRFPEAAPKPGTVHAHVKSFSVVTGISRREQCDRPYAKSTARTLHASL
jgi:hypothetical protein